MNEKNECYDLSYVIDLLHRVNDSVLRKKRHIPSQRYWFKNNEVVLDATLELLQFLPSARKLKQMAKFTDGYYHIPICR